MTTINSYLLENQMSDGSFNNERTKAYLIEKLTGGECCSGQNIFKYTMQKHNKNQTTLSGNLLQGGRVSMPSQYFGNVNKGYTANNTFTKTSSITPTLAKQGLQSNFFKGGSKMTAVKKFLVGGHTHSKQVQNDLMQSYHSNVDAFLNNIKELSGGKMIYKTTINKALRQLKN